MNTELFIDRCQQAFPGKELTASQWAIYREKLRRFTEAELFKIYDWLLENSKFFPKIADVFDAARQCGYLDRAVQFKPYTWQSTDCNKCAGSGMVAAWYSQECENREGGPVEILRLVGLEPYQSSAGSQNKPGHDIRAFYRCQCAAGEMPQGMTGLPRWDSKTAMTQRERAF